jgi:hypothetical protein
VHRAQPANCWGHRRSEGTPGGPRGQAPEEAYGEISALQG